MILLPSICFMCISHGDFIKKINKGRGEKEDKNTRRKWEISINNDQKNMILTNNFHSNQF